VRATCWAATAAHCKRTASFAALSACSADTLGRPLCRISSPEPVWGATHVRIGGRPMGSIEPPPRLFRTNPWKQRRFFYRQVAEELLRKELKTAKPKGGEQKAIPAKARR